MLGTLASWTIKATVIATWKQSDPATWNLPFQLAPSSWRDRPGRAAPGPGGPDSRRRCPADRTRRARPARDELRDILSGPNAKVLVAGSLLFWAGTVSTAYVAILFFQRVLHAGQRTDHRRTGDGFPVFMIGIALGVPLSRWPGSEPLVCS